MCKKLMFLMGMIMLLGLVNALVLEEGTFIQTSGTNYNTTILINSTLTSLSVTANDISMNNVTFLAIENLNDTESVIINLTNIINLKVIYGNGTISSLVSGNQDLQISAGDKIYLFSLNYIMIDSGLTNYQRFNEHAGTTSHDSSGNGNDGTITGATWQNDGVLLNLIEGTDYDLDSSTYMLNVSLDYTYSYIMASWTYSAVIGGSCAFNGMITSIGTAFGVAMLAIIGFIGIIGTFVGLRWLLRTIKGNGKDDSITNIAA